MLTVMFVLGCIALMAACVPWGWVKEKFLKLLEELGKNS